MSPKKKPFGVHACKGNEASSLLHESRKHKSLENIKYLLNSFREYKSYTYDYFLAHVGKQIVGSAMLAPSTSDNPTEVCLRFLSVHPDFQGQGIGRQLNEAVFSFCAENNLSLVYSSYTQMGAKTLKPMNTELALKYNVPFRDSDMEREEEFKRTYNREPTEEEKTKIWRRY